MANKTLNNVKINMTLKSTTTRAKLSTSSEDLAVQMGKINKWYDSLVPTGGASGNILEWDSDGVAKWVTPSFLDEKVKSTLLAQSTAEGSYRPTFVTGAGTGGVNIIDSFKVNHTPGTTNVVGNTQLILGNATASGTANNEEGQLKLYSSGTSFHTLKGTTVSSEVIHVLPSTAGTILNHVTTTYTQTSSSSADGAYEIGKIKINGTPITIYGHDVNTTYTATDGIKIESNVIKHTNSIATAASVFKKISYDAQGHITGTANVVASDIPALNYVPNTNAGVNTAINLLSTGSSTPTDDDYYISQYVGGGTTTTTYHRRPMSALWSYIKGKADPRYAPIDHNHTLSIAADSGTSQLTLSPGTKYKLTAGGSSFIFTASSYSAGTGISLSGTTFSNTGVRSTTINGNYLRVNTNGTNADLTIPYATTASKLGTSTVGSGSRPVYLNAGTPTQCDTPTSGAYWNGVPGVDSNGVMEIGKYIDFHASNTTNLDYDYRITAESQVLHFSPKSSGDATYNLLQLESPDYNQIRFSTSKTGKAYTSTGIVAYPLTTSGQTMLIQSDGNTVVGGGESPRTLYSNSYDNMDTAENETLYLASDSSEIHFITNCQAYSGRKVLKVQDGQLVKTGGQWIAARDVAPVYTNKPNTQDGAYYPAWFGKTKSGGWSMGVLSHSDNLYITYTTDEDYSEGNNNNTYLIQFQNKSGTVALTSDLTNTTYTLGTSGNNVTLTPSSGSVQSITVPYATNANNINTTVTNGTTSRATYGITFAADPNASESNTLRKNNDFRLTLINGTTSAGGSAELILGNDKNTTTADNKEGLISLYSSNTSYHVLKVASTTSAITHTFPATSGTILNSGTTSFTRTLTSGTKIGSIKINGTSTDIYAPTNTDEKVKVTLGTTTKAYLLGTTTTPTATAQPVTSIADTGVYLDTTAGMLTATTFKAGNIIEINNSGGMKVTANTASAWARGIEYYVGSTYTSGIGGRGDANAFAYLYMGKYDDNITRFYQSDKSTYFYGTVHLKENLYGINPVESALNCHNSNITGINSLIFEDLSDNAGEGIMFYRSATPSWDVIWAKDGLLHFSPNYPTDSDNLSMGIFATNSNTDAWSSIGVGLYTTERFQLKIIRTGTTNTYPSWMGWAYSAAIAFGGADTKGVISVRYDAPGVMFIGGQNDSSHTKPNWSFGLTGTSGTTYNLNSMNAYSFSTVVTDGPDATNYKDYGVLYVEDPNASENNVPRKTNDFRVRLSNGTASAEGYIELILGNNKNATTAGNKGAKLSLYSSGGGWAQIIYDNTTANNTFKVPAKTAGTYTFATTSDLSGYLPLAGGDMTGTIRATSSNYPNTHIAIGVNKGTDTNDYAGLDKKNNVDIRSWYGFSISNGNSGSGTIGANTVAFSVDARYGTTYARGWAYANKFATAVGTTWVSSGYYTKDSNSKSYPLVFDNGSNLWVGAEQSAAYHHKGQTYISTGWSGTLPTTAGGTLAGHSTIFISIPTYTATSATAGSWSHAPKFVLHSGNFTTTGSGNAITSVAFTNEQLTFTKGSTFALSTHTHLYAGSSSAGGAATSANKLNTNAGTVSNPVYFTNGVPTACDYPKSGAWAPAGGGVPFVTSSGVLEIGPYIDFHGTTSTAGYDLRLSEESTNLLALKNTAPTFRIHSTGHTNAALELWREGDNYTDYRIINTGGQFKIQSDYIEGTGHTDWFDMLHLAYTTGNATFKGSGTFGGIITTYRESSTADNLPAGIVFSNKDTTTGLTYSGAHIYAYNDHANPSYGENLVINASGCLFIGSGEAPDSHYAAIKSGLSTYEDTYMTADRYVYIQGCGGAIAARKGMMLYTTDSYHQILPTVADTATNNVGSIGSSSYKWNAMYASSYYGEFDCLNEVANNTQYAMVLAMNPNTHQPNTLRKTPNAIMTFKNGTASEEGWAQITLGNETKAGTAGNSTGWIKLYSPSSGSHYITGASTTSTITHTLPAVSGTVLNSGNYLQYTRSIQKLYAATSTKGWRRILTIPASNSSGYTIGRYEFHFTRQWNNGPPESFGVRVICNYTTPVIHLLYAEQNSRLLTDFRVTRSSDSTKIHFEVWYDATTKNDFSVRYVIQDPYLVPHDFCTFPTETDGSSAGSSFLPVVSDSPTSQATIPIPTGGISQFNLRQVSGSYSGYFGMADATGSDSAWIRTTSQGLLPYQSSNATDGGICSIGASGWYFKDAYIGKVVSNTADFECFQPRHSNEFSMKQISYNYIWFNYRLITDDKQGFTTEPTNPINQYWFGCGKARNALAKVVTSGMTIYPGAANATSYSTTLQSASLTANRTATLPNATGTIPLITEKYNSPTSTATSYNLTYATSFKLLMITTKPSSSLFGETTVIVPAPTAAGTTKTYVNWPGVNAEAASQPTRTLGGNIRIRYTNNDTCTIDCVLADYYLQAGSSVSSGSTSGFKVYITRVIGISY